MILVMIYIIVLLIYVYIFIYIYIYNPTNSTNSTKCIDYMCIAKKLI